MTARHSTELLPGLTVSRETVERLETLLSLTAKWSETVNLVSSRSLSDGWLRHILDSAQVWNCAPADFRSWADFGSGGGFPGLVVSILASELKPEARFVLVDSDSRKAVFLRECSRLLDLKATIINDRIEHLEPLHVDIVSARALAPLNGLLNLVHHHMAPDGICLFPKGASYSEEIEDAKIYWRFESEVVPSVTDSSCAVLKIWGVSRV